MSATGNTRGPIRWKHSLAWLALLAPLFFLSYGWANQLAASRGVTDSIVFGWESAIPFLPWTIVPYWSIDLMYGLSFLACRTPREVNHHGLRLLTAQLISVACFVAFPLRFTGEKPASEGMFGALFDALAGFDLPYNQAPSLHISLLVIIWWVLVRRASPAWKWVWHGWALLVAANYAWVGPEGFQKHDGHQSTASRWLLAPYRLGAWINSRLWTRGQAPADAITDRVWIGRYPGRGDLAAGGFDALLDLTAEFHPPVRAEHHHNEPMLDLATPDLPSLRRAAEALEALHAKAGRILVCCALGYSRSAMTVAAWLLHSGRAASVNEAIETVRQGRPQVVLGAEHRALLERLHRGEG